MIKIEGWDYAPSQCSSKMQTLLYFIPDWDMISFLHINGNLNVPLKIENNGMYEGEFFARVDKQPNTVFHVAFLPLNFRGFPSKNGHLTLMPSYRCVERQVLDCIQNGCCVR